MQSFINEIRIGEKLFQQIVGTAFFNYTFQFLSSIRQYSY
ncbi:hypothetical protein B4079_5756 [Bacillus cereus]|nr:hypothetical protein B4079_5756 [Bacillus cereus]